MKFYYNNIKIAFKAFFVFASLPLDFVLIQFDNEHSSSRSKIWNFQGGLSSFVKGFQKQEFMDNESQD